MAVHWSAYWKCEKMWDFSIRACLREETFWKSLTICLFFLPIVTQRSFYNLLLILGEYIKTWRPRYFLLKSDGTFIGYKERPQDVDQLETPLNNFSVAREYLLQRNHCFIFPSVYWQLVLPPFFYLLPSCFYFHCCNKFVHVLVLHIPGLSTHPKKS